jgi:hypothetical protein
MDSMIDRFMAELCSQLRSRQYSAIDVNSLDPLPKRARELDEHTDHLDIRFCIDTALRTINVNPEEKW